MGNFDQGLLKGCVGITVENPCTSVSVAIEFQRCGGGEFRTVIGENDGEQLAKGISPKICIESFKNIDNRLRGVPVSEISQEQRRVAERYRK